MAAPGAASVPTGIVAQATAHRDRYAAIFWQLTHDLAAEVTTTVDGAAPHPLDVAGLAAFASGAWGYLAHGRRHRPADRDDRRRRHAGQHRRHLPGQPGRAGPGQPVRRAELRRRRPARPRRDADAWRTAARWSRTTRWPGSPSGPPWPGPPADAGRRQPGAGRCSPARCSPWARPGPSPSATRWRASRPRRAWTGPSSPARMARCPGCSRPGRPSPRPAPGGGRGHPRGDRRTAGPHPRRGGRRRRRHRAAALVSRCPGRYPGGGHRSYLRIPGPGRGHAGERGRRVRRDRGRCRRGERVRARPAGAGPVGAPRPRLLRRSRRATRSRRSPRSPGPPSPAWPRPTPPPPACSRPGRPSPSPATSCSAGTGPHQVAAGDTLRCDRRPQRGAGDRARQRQLRRHRPAGQRRAARLHAARRPRLQHRHGAARHPVHGGAAAAGDARRQRGHPAGHRRAARRGEPDGAPAWRRGRRCWSRRPT